MRLYGKKILKRSADSRVKKATESRDAVLWDIDQLNHTCRVKILGSDEFVVASIPQNYRDTPAWLKVGGAVRIAHRSGVRGYVEVVSEGRAIPSGVFPSTGAQGDQILDGMNLMATDPASDSIYITTGSYRIGGNIYFWDGANYIIMGDNPIPMGDQPELIGVGYSTFALDPPPAAKYFRYDAFVIGTDGVVDYIKGVQALASPAYPVVPSGHLLIAYILRVYDDLVIDQYDINRLWLEPAVTYMTWTGCTPNLPFMTNTRNFVVTVRDQYGSQIIPPAGHQEITFEVTLNSGEVYSSRDGWARSVGCTCTTGQCTFTYRRDGAVWVPDPPPGHYEEFTEIEQPMIMATLHYPGYVLQCWLLWDLLPP